MRWDVFRFKETRMPWKWARVQEWWWLDTAKRPWPSHPSPSLLQSHQMQPNDPICHLFIIISGSAHSNRARRWTQNLQKFIGSVQSAWSGAERNSFLFVLPYFFAARCDLLAAKRRIESNRWKLSRHIQYPICMAGQQRQLCLTLILHRTSDAGCEPARRTRCESGTSLNHPGPRATPTYKHKPEHAIKVL